LAFEVALLKGCIDYIRQIELLSVNSTIDDYSPIDRIIHLERRIYVCVCVCVCVCVFMIEK